MKTSKIAVSLVTVALSCFAATAAVAAPLDLTDGDKIKLNWGIAPTPYGGGPFSASGVPGSVLNGPGDSFLTFCVEFPEHISLNTGYFVKLNTSAVNGGYSTGGTYVGDTNGGPTFDPLSKATAWLYTQYRTNTAALNRVGDMFVNDLAHGNSMQMAIWKLEGELSGSALTTYNGDLRAQEWVTAAITQSASWNDLGRVRVMNLYDTYDARTGVFSGLHQDQLYLAPVPEPETYAMMLAGLGLLGLAAARRRKLAV